MTFFVPIRLSVRLGLLLVAEYPHVHPLLLLLLPGRPAAAGHDGHGPGPPHAHQLRAGKKHQARGKEAAARDGEEHEEDGLGGHQVVPPHHEGRVVRGVEAGEARGA